MFTAFRALVRKDLRLFFSDRRAVLMSMVAPILIGSFFGYVFGGRSGRTETSRIPLTVIDRDQSVMSREIVTKLSANSALEVKSSTAEETARQQVGDGKTTLAVVIPQGFGEQAGRAFFGAPRKPQIAILYDPLHRIELSMVQGILAGQVMQVVSREMFGGAAGREMVDDTLARTDRIDGLDPARKKALLDLLRGVRALNQQAPIPGVASGLSVPYQVREDPITAKKEAAYNGYAHSFAGMGVQFILFVGVDVGVNMLLMRQRGLWKRLRAAPLSRAMLLGSRAASAALTSMLVLFVIFSFARLAFGVRIEGSMAGFLGVCVAFSFMTAAFGLLIAALGKTPDATRGLSILATLLMVMLGGSWVPTFVFPQWLQKIALFVPTRWAMDGLDAMTWRGMGFSSAVAPILVLLGSAVVFGTLAVMRFRWEIDG